MPDRSLHEQYRERLFEAGLLLPLGADGLYGRSERFEQIVWGLEKMILAAGSDQDATVVRFPPVVPRPIVEASGYLRNFPTLTGVVSTFDGDDRRHSALLNLLETGADWTTELEPTDTSMCAAACHPLYTCIDKAVPAGGQRWNVYGYVFRYEPSLDPARLQSFRQYEYVCVGDATTTVEHRDTWRDRSLALVCELGIDARAEVANDPFFGRAGRMLAGNQVDEELKFEIVAATSPDPGGTAIASANCHRDHFGHAFDLHLPDGSVAHSSCVGFGVERITLALLWAHGADTAGWPAVVRRRLDLA